MSLTLLLAQYGYLAVLIGCMLEGETLLLLAGFAAHRGYLSFPLVIALAFIGGTLGDQFFFFIGRRYGPPLLSRFPRLATRAERAKKLIERYHSGLIVAVRFMYGLRIAGPLAIGMSGVSAWRFVAFNMLGAAIWAPLIGGIGFVFGETLQWLLHDIKHFELAGLGGLVVAAALLRLVHYLRARRRSDQRH
ncbi:DedA family protein [Paludibacterium yongneupense]|uniref:DedA family protein n=1 Tax=Paludibacterium yongneupense TaxID=400061 RepID=UPI00048A9F70|nr:DedA family protein [Paludibacterium yongneupense]